MTREFLSCPVDSWLARLAEGWRLACEDQPLPVADLIEWNSGWPVVLLVRGE